MIPRVKIQPDRLGIRVKILSAILSNSFWMEYAMKQAVIPSNGSVQEILCRIAKNYTEEILKD